MANNIVQFQFGFNDVRVALINGEPWFVAKDVCAVLGLSDYHQATERLDNDERDTSNVPTPGGNQDMVVISESGFYRLVMTSRKQSVKKFQKWVTAEVIPSIRKTGSYSVGKVERQLPPIRDTINYIEAKQYIDNCQDPIFKSYAMQSLYEDMGIKSLPSSNESLVLAAVKARSLGYILKPGEDSKLGKWVAKHCTPVDKTQHGRYKVNVYRDDDRLAETIAAFFA